MDHRRYLGLILPFDWNVHMAPQVVLILIFYQITWFQTLHVHSGILYPSTVFNGHTVDPTFLTQITGFQVLLALSHITAPCNGSKIYRKFQTKFGHKINKATMSFFCGLVYGRHNKSKDLNCDLLGSAGLKQVIYMCISEPIICESDSNGDNGLFMLIEELEVSENARLFW